ncbi:hypothetical protein AB395_00002813 [Sinorhizobium fredii CCBAU 45436]|nr:hypothetical protein AB395_00002813 [Sinorhizobium fredii CCBAU 45436]
MHLGHPYAALFAIMLLLVRFSPLTLASGRARRPVNGLPAPSRLRCAPA